MQNTLNPSDSRSPLAYFRRLRLLDFLLADVISDVEVVARDLGLSVPMHRKLRRALDRLDCAGEVLETSAEDMPEHKGCGDVSGKVHRPGCEGSSDAERPPEATIVSIRRTLTMLAANWPQEYPDDAVEWLVFEEPGPQKVYAKN